MMMRLNAILCAAALLCSATDGFSQQKQPPKTLPPSVIDPTTGLPVPKTKPGPQFDLNFNGGSPEALIDLIKAVSGTRPNVVIHPECESVIIPAFQLSAVTAAQVFNALNTLNEPDYKDGTWRRVPDDDNEIWTLTRPVGRAHGYPVEGGGFTQRLAQITQGNRTARICKVFNLAIILETYSIDDVTTAIIGALELLNPKGEPSIKFHKDTKLLIVVCDDDQISVVVDVVRELTSNVMQKNAPPAKPSELAKPSEPASSKTDTKKQ